MTETKPAQAAADVEPISDEFRATIATILREFIDDKQSQLASVGSDLSPLLVTARSYVEGGKRLRPAFAYWGYRAAGGSDSKSAAVKKAAAAIELVHASALVHDDVMDDSATRRGGLSAHRQFAGMWRDTKPTAVADQFGTMAAILLGDLLLSWSDELLSQSGLPPKALARGRVYFDKLRTEVVAGQYLDVLAQTRQSSSAADAMRVVRYKSAKYTVERPLQLGAAFGRAEPRLLAALSGYAIPLGEAFQLRDDVLGVFGDHAVTGKPSGDDIREGKRTLLMARAYDRATAVQRRTLDANLGRRGVDSDGIEQVQTVLRETGAVDAVETVITELTAASLSALKHARIADDDTRTALRVLTDRATRRAV